MMYAQQQEASVWYHKLGERVRCNRLLINVTQLLVLGIHKLINRSVPEDSIRRNRRVELVRMLISKVQR